MSEEIDIEFRPETYFGPLNLRAHLIAQTKGAVVRSRLERLMEHGRLDEVDLLLGDTGVPDEILKDLGSIHPMLMGGELSA